MNREEKELLLQRFLDGELKPDQEREALMAIADEPELRRLLRFDNVLSRGLSTPLEEAERFRVPEDFSDRVMQRIEALETEEKSAAVRDEGVSDAGGGTAAGEGEWRGAIAAFVGQLWSPRPVALRPAWAAAILLAAGLGWGLYATGEVERQTASAGQAEVMTTDVVAEQEEDVWIRFVYIDPDAEGVAVAGDFTGWEPLDLTPEQVGGQQVWTGMVRVPRGEQHYMFVRNGEEWVTDPFAEYRREDGFGNENAVLIL